MPNFSLEYIENGQKQSFPFDTASVSIGRDKASDFVLDHPTVSRQHALIVHNQRGYQLVVLSRGGMTAIDGSPVSGDVDLYDGNVLHFGQLNFTFRSPDAPAKSTSGSGQQSSPGMGGGMGNGGFGQQPGFSQQPQGGGFGGQQQGGGFGGQQQGGGFGGQQQGGGFGGQQQGGGFGGQQQGGGFGDQQQQGGGFGGQQQAGGFGGQQQGGGFGGQQQGGGFGGQQQSGQSGMGQQQGGGFGAPGGGFGMGMGPEGQSQQAKTDPEPADPNGIRSWDEIANSAEAMDGDAVDDGLSDFQRIQAAQAKAVEQSKGTNPLVVVIALVIGGGLMAYTFWPAPETGGNFEVKAVEEVPYIAWNDETTDCVGEAECMKKAETAFAVGVDLLEKQDVELSFKFEGYKNLELADIYVEKAGKERPAKFAKADQAKQKIRDELDVLFRQFRAEYHSAQQRKMYKDMARVINRVKTYFPYAGAREHIWAKSKENDMKDRGIYPRKDF